MSQLHELQIRRQQSLIAVRDIPKSLLYTETARELDWSRAINGVRGGGGEGHTRASFRAVDPCASRYCRRQPSATEGVARAM